MIRGLLQRLFNQHPYVVSERKSEYLSRQCKHRLTLLIVLYQHRIACAEGLLHISFGVVIVLQLSPTRKRPTRTTTLDLQALQVIGNPFVPLLSTFPLNSHKSGSGLHGHRFRQLEEAIRDNTSLWFVLGVTKNFMLHRQEEAARGWHQLLSNVVFVPAIVAHACFATLTGSMSHAGSTCKIGRLMKAGQADKAEEKKKEVDGANTVAASAESQLHKVS